MLAAIGSAGVLSGCLATDDDEQDDSEPGGSGQTDEPAQSADDVLDLGPDQDGSENEQTAQDLLSDEVDPSVVEVYATRPRLISMDEDMGTINEYTVTVQNTGTSGEVGIEFLWVEDMDGPIDGVDGFGNTQKSNERILYFDANERRDVSFVGTPPRGYEGYAFDLFTATFEGEVRNRGGPGEVEVRLKDPNLMDAIVERRTIILDEGETERVEFTVESPLSGDEFEIEAAPATS